MAYTVTHPAGFTKDFEFEAYARLLRQTGKDLGHLPRVPDPEAPERRWLYVWNNRPEAEKFARDLERQTRGTQWQVVATAAPPSEGPFGPILLQLARRSDGLVISLHPLSLALIRDAFPNAKPAGSNTFVDSQTWSNFLGTQGTLRDLVWNILPSLTGLSSPDLTSLGYAVVDADRDKTWVYVPPVFAE